MRTAFRKSGHTSANLTDKDRLLGTLYWWGIPSDLFDRHDAGHADPAPHSQRVIIGKHGDVGGHLVGHRWLFGGGQQLLSQV